MIFLKLWWLTSLLGLKDGRFIQTNKLQKKTELGWTTTFEKYCDERGWVGRLKVVLCIAHNNKKELCDNFDLYFITLWCTFGNTIRINQNYVISVTGMIHYRPITFQQKSIKPRKPLYRLKVPILPEQTDAKTTHAILSVLPL